MRRFARHEEEVRRAERLPRAAHVAGNQPDPEQDDDHHEDGGPVNAEGRAEQPAKERIGAIPHPALGRCEQRRQALVGNQQRERKEEAVAWCPAQPPVRLVRRSGWGHGVDVDRAA